jgi:hypothetical protein
MEEIPYRLPLVIGATGHRDLRDENISDLEREVGKAIERLKEQYLGSDAQTPIVVLSSLAEGADRLIARVAMARGAKLIAPLPMPPDEYRGDFKPGLKPDALPEFDRLLGDAVAAPIMPFVTDNTPENVHKEARRALQYREVGLFIVRHCHVLIALWNGDEENKAVGGTAEVVSFKREGIPIGLTNSARASLDAPEIGPVIHVTTPRAKPGASVPRVKTDPWGAKIVQAYRGGVVRRALSQAAKIWSALFKKKPDEDDVPTRDKQLLETWEAFARKTGLTREFNRDAAKLEGSPDCKQRLATSLKYLFDDPELNQKEKLAGEPAQEWATKVIPHWCALYELADTLAQERQKRFVWDWRVLLGLGFGSIVAFEMLTHLFFDEYWLLAVYTAIFVGIIALFSYARWRHHQERFLDYRALAEALRVAVFWKIVGMGLPAEGPVTATADLSSGESVADAYPIRQPRELDWVKTCLRTLELLDVGRPSAPLKGFPESEAHLWARKFWVHGQLAFFHRRGPQHEHHAAKLLTWSLVLLIVSSIFALLLFLADYGAFGPGLKWTHERWPHRIAIFVIGLVPAIAAVRAGYAERLALEAHARQYDRMRTLFLRAHEIFQSGQLTSFAQAQALYRELGIEAMKENAEWVAIYRQRPIRPS